MPWMTDARFARTVILLCAHNAEGAMGLVINKRLESLTYAELMDQLDIGAPRSQFAGHVHFGGPVESGRGFVLHSADYVRDGTMVVSEEIALTATIDILRAIAAGQGPERNLLALGYAGWGPGQLEAEIHDNAWLNVPPDAALVFDPEIERKWERALGKLGIDHKALSGMHGHA
jgi:putative transcriptional regulator